MNKFEEVVKIDVSSYTEKKNGLTYLSWAMAWKEFCKFYPNATYEIKKNDLGTPEFGSSERGFMVYTTVTVEELTHEMWLPVMDYKNKSMMNPTSFDVNKAVMRCLTKNLAMFGLGLNVYTGEDYPSEDDKDRKIENKSQQAKTFDKKKAVETITKMIDGNIGIETYILEKYSIKSLELATETQLKNIYKELKEDKNG